MLAAVGALSCAILLPKSFARELDEHILQGWARQMNVRELKPGLLDPLYHVDQCSCGMPGIHGEGLTVLTKHRSHRLPPLRHVYVTELLRQADIDSGLVTAAVLQLTRASN